MPVDPAAPDEPGRIITFYSYKGGTGRTMAVANTAWILASNGLRVLTVDWDLESPGLHRYFHPFMLDKHLRSSRGVIDLIRDFSAATMEPSGRGDDPGWFEEHAQILRFAASLEWPFPNGGTIDFVPAGQQDASYSMTVSTFDWQSFYDRQSGGVFLEALRRNMCRHYDYVLIDSRTGLSDTAGICTVKLPDLVANCFTMSTQSIDGAVAVANSIIRQRPDQPVRIVPVPMRVEDGEQVKLEAGRDYARSRFEPFLRGWADQEPERYWGDVEVPYKPYFAYEEILATFGERPHQEGSLLAAFERLARVLTDGQVTELVPLDERVRRRWLTEFERPTPTVASDVFVSYAAVDRMWAEWVRAELAEAGLHVILQGVDLPAGSDYLTEIERSIASATRTLVLLSQEYVTSPFAEGIWKTVAAKDPEGARRLLVPVRLDNVRLVSPFADRVPIDLVGLAADRAREVLLAAVDHPSFGEPSARAGGEEPAVRFPGTPPQVSNLSQRNGAFTGRAAALDEIRERFSRSATSVPHQVLYGLGGVGKTQIALEYAYRFDADYDVVWWIPADQPSLVRSSLSALAPRLGLPTGESISDSVRTVLDALRQGRPYGRWLLVFDNADEPAELSELLPQQGQGHVLITSRSPAWALHATGLEVDVFTREESIGFLTKRVSGVPEIEADLVAEKLGDLPLAIEQAGAWLAATAMPVSRYLELLDTRLPQVLEENPPSDYPRTAAATWLLSLDRLREQMPAAARLLELCAFFAPEPIPMRLLYSERVSALLAPFDPALRDPILLSRVVQEIGRYALARIDSAQSSIELHRLVQAVVREQLSEEQQVETRRKVYEILAAANPKDTDDPEYWPQYAELWPHASRQILESDSGDVRQLVADLVRYLWRIGDYTTSQELAENALRRWTESFGENDLTTLLVKYHLVNTLWSQAGYEKARELAEETLDRFHEVVGKDHPYALITATALGANLRALGEYRSARDLDADILKRSRLVFGEDHARTLSAANNLAVSLRLVGDIDGATRLDEDTFNRRRRVLGLRHPTTLVSQQNYGRDLREGGDFAGSRTYLESALVAYREVVGEDYADTLRTAKNFAVTLRKMGEFGAAYALTKDTLTTSERVFGPDHPDTLACALNLACDQSALGEHARAGATAETVLERYQHKLGERHAFTQAATNNLAIFLRLSGDHVNARPLSEQVLASQRETLGPDHPYTLACAVNHANDLYVTGDYAAARALDESTYGRLSEVVGLDHPDTLAAGNNLAISRDADEDPAGARALREEILDRMRAKLGDNHPNTVAARRLERLNCDIEPPST